MNQPTLPDISHVSHSNLGKSFEKELAATHEYYAMRKLAVIEQNPVAWRYCGLGEFNKMASSTYELVAKTNTGRFIKKVKSDVDFAGVVKPGKFVTFDAKEIKGKSFPLSKVSDHQVRNLVNKELIGAVSGLMIHFSELNRVFFVSALIVEKAYVEMLYKGGKKSLSLAFCELKGIEIPTRQNLIDWLPVLVK